MATYGRQKRSLLTSFSIFHDDKVKGNMSRKEREVRQFEPEVEAPNPLLGHGDGSIDGLVDALLDDSTQGFPTPSSSAVNQPRSSIVSKSGMDRIFPSSSKQEKVEQRQIKGSLKALAARAIGVMTFSKSMTSKGQPKSSAETPNPINATSNGQVALDATRKTFDIQTDLGSSITQTSIASSGIRPVAEGNIQTGDAAEVPKIKTSRLRRSKETIARAKKNIANQLSGQKAKGKDRGTANERASCSTDEIAGPGYDVVTEMDQRRFNRRIAEGQNLGNPKIRELTGNRTPRVPRKPLPVFVARSIRHPSFSSDNTFSDNQGTFMESSSLESSTLGDSFGRRKKVLSVYEPLLPKNESIDRAKVGHTEAEAFSPSRFCETISGLAQHPVTDLFFGNPVASSTPRYRLEPQIDANGKKRLSTVTAHDYGSAFDLNDENTPDLSPKAAYSPLHLKRKKATLDLRIESSPGIKTNKMELASSPYDAALTTRLGTLNATGDVLAVKDSNKKMSGMKLTNIKDKGLKIFEIDKSTESLAGGTGNAKTTKPRKRARAPTPVKIKGSSRPSANVLLTDVFTEEESTSADELQMA